MEKVLNWELYELWCSFAYKDTMKETWHKTFDDLDEKEQRAWNEVTKIVNSKE